MSDRASGSITIFAAPAEIHETIADLIEDAFDPDADGETPWSLVLGEKYTSDSLGGGTIAELVEHLSEVSEHIAYRGFQGAVDGCDAEEYASAPGHGPWAASVSVDGEPIISRDTVIAALAAVREIDPMAYAKAVQQIDIAFGVPQDIAVDDIASRLLHTGQSS